MFNFQSKQYKSRVKSSLTVRRLSFYLHRALVSSKCTVQPAERTLPNLRLPFNLKSMNLKSACEQTQCMPTVYHIMLQFCLLSLFQKNNPNLINLLVQVILLQIEKYMSHIKLLISQ